MARNDIHCPTNFKPQDYTLEDHFGVIYIPNMDQRDHEGTVLPEAYGDGAMEYYDASDTENNPHPSLNQCDLCGQTFVHGAVLTHKDGDVISVGGICMAGIAGVPALSEGQKLYAAKKAITQRNKMTNLRGMLAANSGLNAALHTDHYISKDLRASILNWGTLSDKQVALAFKIAKDEANRTPDAPQGPVPVSDKRILIEGAILGTKTKETQWGTTEMMLISVPLGDGTACKLWGSVPSAVSDAQWAVSNAGGEWPTLKGTKLSFMARVEPSNDDPNFGFIKRPTKVTVEFP